MASFSDTAISNMFSFKIKSQMDPPLPKSQNTINFKMAYILPSLSSDLYLSLSSSIYGLCRKDECMCFLSSTKIYYKKHFIFKLYLLSTWVAAQYGTDIESQNASLMSLEEKKQNKTKQRHTHESWCKRTKDAY